MTEEASWSEQPEPGQEPCSVLSRELGEPINGSAPTSRTWLLIEVRTAWASKPLATFPSEVAEALGAAEKATGGTVVLVRRPRFRGDEASEGELMWRMVDVVARTQVSGHWREVSDLVEVAARWTRGEAGEPAVTTCLVCCHGKRDVCCAVRGRPVAGELAAGWAGDVWESTHLNGHRFAPTLLVLPQGVHLGRVPAERAVEAVTAAVEGMPPVEMLRGWVTMTGPEQAAACAWLGTYGETPETVTSEATEDGFRVHVEGVSYDVRAERSSPRRLSCGDGPPKTSTTYVVEPSAEAVE